ncbi:benzoate/H(+) symporter BenE family transporter [Capillimicrobium parvum]|uniref:Inner membrane protein YdcO n=1 Tax=Capillimicrobium parvum TaxID=2884022 RepID=A0A9E6XSK1_9ACTN|nr:benzoate/H(+) symporter BenE family transporter [Capillimicrobium parvum]UGS33874.1 Inner membrane protein YdcO [Capillimicrobium parvum]
MSRVTSPVIAGVVTALVGFAGTFAIVLAGYRAIGATNAEAASGILVLTVGAGVVGIVLAARYRMPIGIAWSTPGAALLASNGAIDGGYPAALGAFVVCGLLLVVAGLWRRFGSALEAIPAPLANAVLAGVLVPVCLAPLEAVFRSPSVAIPTVVTWLLLMWWRARWAVPGAFAVMAIAVAIDPLEPGGGFGGGLPELSFTLPAFTVAGVAGLALPLFIVTMASQNIPGLSVLRSYGYRPPLRPILVSTGGASALIAPFGAHTLNLAAITAAMLAAPSVDPVPARRWIAAAGAGAVYVVLGLCSGLVMAVLASAPLLAVKAVAGLALLATLRRSLTAALEPPGQRLASIVAMGICASPLMLWGIGAPLWGLLAGLVLFVAMGRAKHSWQLARKW